ncbi:MAG: hypothetical protein Q8920_13735 [Bacillota bacterium]|nr:hypothetical protein [Bacillota bacterium]
MKPIKGFFRIAYAASFEQPNGMGLQLASQPTALYSVLKISARIGSVFFYCILKPAGDRYLRAFYMLFKVAVQKIIRKSLD